MSETETNSSAPSPCDQLLDFVYGELDEAGKRAFEAHLATCARCQADAAAFGRSHQAAQRVMPAVEPPANLTGALHAQLMHAASQRRPKRGVVLQLFRRVAQHPQMAAAAMFLLVGGAFVFTWSKAKRMPTSAELAPSVAEAPKPLEPEEANDKLAANQPTGGIGLAEGGKLGELAKREAPATKNKEADVPSELRPEATPEARIEGKPSTVVLKTPPASYNVDRPSRHASASAGKPAPKLRGVAKDQLDDVDLQLADSSFKSAKGGDTARMEGNGAFGGLAGGSGAGGVVGSGSLGRAQGAKSSAPGTPSLQQAPNGLAQATTAAPPPPPSAQRPAKSQPANEVAPQSPPMPSAAPAPVANSRDGEYGYAMRDKAVTRKPNAVAAADVEAARKKLDELARSNRCDEAIKLFQELERSTQVISPTERAQYVHCLTQKGRQQEAEQQLLELKADKKTTGAEVQKLQEELDGTRAKQRRADKKKAMPAPADERASEAPSQQAQQAPAAAPPQASPAQPQQQRKSDRNSSKAPAAY